MGNKKRLFTIITTLFLLFGVCTHSYGAIDDFENGKKAYVKNDFPLASQYFRRALANSPTNITYRYYLAQCLVQTRDLEKAQREYQRIIQVSPHSREAKYAKIALVKISDYVKNVKTPRWRPKDSTMAITKMETTSKADVGDNYIDKTTDKGNVVHWDPEKMPIKVYIDDTPKGIDSLIGNYIPAIRRGVKRWEQGTDGLLSFTFTNSPADAEIVFSWQGTFNKKLSNARVGTAYTAGITSPKYVGNTLKEMAIILTPVDPTGRPHKAEDIEKITAHEMGHALGIMGHSNDPTDIMYPTNQNQPFLSKRDINTIKLLYAMEPDITNGDANSDQFAHNKDEILGSKRDRLDNEIDSLLEEVKNNPNSDLAHMNLANLYGEKKQFDKAIKEYKQALKINPNNDTAYTNLGIIYQDMGRTFDALGEFYTARRKNPGKAKNHLLIAGAATELGQKAEAIDALRKYLALEPSAKETQEVQLLAKQLELVIK